MKAPVFCPQDSVNRRLKMLTYKNMLRFFASSLLACEHDPGVCIRHPGGMFLPVLIDIFRIDFVIIILFKFIVAYLVFQFGHVFFTQFTVFIECFNYHVGVI